MILRTLKDLAQELAHNSSVTIGPKNHHITRPSNTFGCFHSRIAVPLMSGRVWEIAFRIQTAEAHDVQVCLGLLCENIRSKLLSLKPCVGREKFGQHIKVRVSIRCINSGFTDCVERTNKEEKEWGNLLAEDLNLACTFRENNVNGKMGDFAAYKRAQIAWPLADTRRMMTMTAIVTVHS